MCEGVKQLTTTPLLNMSRFSNLNDLGKAFPKAIQGDPDKIVGYLYDCIAIYQREFHIWRKANQKGGYLRPYESYNLGLFSDYGHKVHNTKMPTGLNVHRSKKRCQEELVKHFTKQSDATASKNCGSRPMGLI